MFNALPGDAFVDRPDDLWPMVLRRQGGMLAAVAHFPAGPGAQLTRARRVAPSRDRAVVGCVLLRGCPGRAMGPWRSW